MGSLSAGEMLGFHSTAEEAPSWEALGSPEYTAAISSGSLSPPPPSEAVKVTPSHRQEPELLHAGMSRSPEEAVMKLLHSCPGTSFEREREEVMPLPVQGLHEHHLEAVLQDHLATGAAHLEPALDMAQALEKDKRVLPRLCTRKEPVHQRRDSSIQEPHEYQVESAGTLEISLPHSGLRLHSVSCPAVTGVWGGTTARPGDASALAGSPTRSLESLGSFSTSSFSLLQQVPSPSEEPEWSQILSDHALSEAALYSVPWEALDSCEESGTQQGSVPQLPHGKRDSVYGCRKGDGEPASSLLDMDTVKNLLELCDSMDSEAPATLAPASASCTVFSPPEHLRQVEEGGKRTSSHKRSMFSARTETDRGESPGGTPLLNPVSSSKKYAEPEQAAALPLSGGCRLRDGESAKEFLPVKDASSEGSTEESLALPTFGTKDMVTQKPRPLAARLAELLRDMEARTHGKHPKRGPGVVELSSTVGSLSTVVPHPEQESLPVLCLAEEKTGALSRQRRKIELSLQEEAGPYGSVNTWSRSGTLSSVLLPRHPQKTSHPTDSSVCGYSMARGPASYIASDQEGKGSKGSGGLEVPIGYAPDSPNESIPSRAQSKQWLHVGNRGLPSNVVTQALVVPYTPRLVTGQVSPASLKCSHPQYQTQVTRQLLRLATAYSTGDMERARKWVVRLKRDASPTGVATQRLLHYMIHGLVSRFEEGELDPVALVLPFLPPVDSPEPLLELALASTRDMYGRLSEVYLSHALKQALEGHSRVHVLLLTAGICPDWDDLFRHLVSHHRKKEALQIRVTMIICSIDAEHAPHMKKQYSVLLKDVADAARRHRLHVPCQLAVVPPRELQAPVVQAHPREVLGVVSWSVLYHTLDSSVLRHNPRDALLKGILGLSPAVFVVLDVDANFNSPFFLARFSESLRMASAALEWVDRTKHFSPGDLLSGSVTPPIYELKIALDFMNCVSAEGLARFQRAENLAMWRDRMRRLGFREKHLDEECFRKMRSEVLHRGLLVENVDGFACVRREESPLFFAGIWH